MKITTVKCDECGVVKEESNHWLHVDVDMDSGPLVHINDAYVANGFERLDLCGQGCFHRHLDKLLFPEKPVALFVEAPPKYYPAPVPGPEGDDDGPAF